VARDEPAVRTGGSEFAPEQLSTARTCDDQEVDPFAVRYVITSPLSLARIMWWYGEDELWQPALELAPAVVADLAERFAELRGTPEIVELLWAGAPLADAYLVLGTLEHLEGRARPAVRRHRRGGPMPEPLDVAETERWHDPALTQVLRLVAERTGSAPGPLQPWQLVRFHGRYAAG
jgi:hypothetical protein